MKFTYLIINLASFIFPFIYSFHPKLKFNANFRYFWPANFTVAAFFIIWDVIFTDLQIWSFNPKYLTGINFFNLPFEEIMFFICIPYACVFTYHCIVKLFIRDNLYFFESTLTPILILLMLLFATININRLYTSVTFTFLAGALFFVKYIAKVKWLSNFYIVYSVLIIPFLIVNGILTGSWLEEPVVIYNDKENIGVRIFTIPFEDIFYGMLMVLLNVALYLKLIEMHKSKRVFLNK